MLLKGQAGSLRVHNTTVKVFMKISEVRKMPLFKPASSYSPNKDHVSNLRFPFSFSIELVFGRYCAPSSVLPQVSSYSSSLPAYPVRFAPPAVIEPAYAAPHFESLLAIHTSLNQ